MVVVVAAVEHTQQYCCVLGPVFPRQINLICVNLIRH